MGTLPRFMIKAGKLEPDGETISALSTALREIFLQVRGVSPRVLKTISALSAALREIFLHPI